MVLSYKKNAYWQYRFSNKKKWQDDISRSTSNDDNLKHLLSSNFFIFGFKLN